MCTAWNVSGLRKRSRVGGIEGADLSGRLGGAGHDLLDGALDAESALDRLPELAVVEGGSAAPLSLEPLDLARHYIRIDRPRIAGGGRFDQHSVDGGLFGGAVNAEGTLGFVGDVAPAEVAGDALGFFADEFLRHGFAV